MSKGTFLTQDLCTERQKRGFSLQKNRLLAEKENLLNLKWFSINYMNYLFTYKY